MKKVYTVLTLAILLAMGLGNAKAQVVDVCAGNDSVVLRLGNFQYGYVQWQVSDDNEEWWDIEGAVDTVYHFLPKRPRYYRAEVRFPQCSEFNYHSQVTYIQMPPTAKAGPDIDALADVPVRMMASTFEGAVGEWSIIEGIGGSFDDVNDPHAMFTGSEGDYQLVWTLTNSCGSSSDTVNVSCVSLVFHDNILIVDETDIILSDTLEMLNGVYAIVFTDTVPDVTEGTVLLGYRERPFMRKVTSFEKVGDVFVMQTEQAALTDIIRSGALCFDFYDLEDDGAKHVTVLDRYPTRNEIAADPTIFRDGKIYLVKGKDRKDDLNCRIKDGKITVFAEFNMKEINPNLDGLTFRFEQEMTNFRTDLKLWDDELIKFYMGFDNSQCKRTFKISASKSISALHVRAKGFLNPNPIFVGAFVLFGVPVVVDLDFPYLFDISASINGTLVEQTTEWTCTHALVWRNGGFEVDKEKSEPVKKSEPLNITGNLNVKAELGAKLGFYIADVLGPTVELKGRFNPSLCASITHPQTITAELSGDIDLELGCRMQAFSRYIGTSIKTSINLYHYSEVAPKKLVRAGGDQQVYNPTDFNFIQSGGYLPNDVQVNVKGWYGSNMPLAIVHFEPENGGEVSTSEVIANTHGIASVRWKPGPAMGLHKLKARVYDCDGNLMAGSPLVFRAYTQGTNDCWNTGLTADFVEHVMTNGTKTIELIVTGGSEPYEWSTDASNYNPLLQTIGFIPEAGHSYTYFVRDAHGCEAEAYYNEPFYDCEVSTLGLNVSLVNGNTINALGEGGLEPYWYSIDGLNYSTNYGSHLPYGFPNLMDGEYTIYVKDALGCVCTKDVTIEREANVGLVIVDAGYDNVGNPVGTVQMLASVPAIYDRGICWAVKTDANVLPTVYDFRHSYGSGSDDYNFTLEGLEPQTYYVRAYVITDMGTAYSNTVEMTPNYIVTTPFVYGTAVSSITGVSANCSSNVTHDGNAEVTDRGFCWSTENESPTLADTHISCGSGTGVFSATLTDLEPLTYYHVCAYATNSQGTSYGLVNHFTTKGNGGGGGGGDHTYVDLGLPSGLLWATCNVGANAPEEYGDYFAWGETQPKDTYSWSTYQYCNGSYNTLTKYCYNSNCGYNGFADDLTILDSDDDAATANWGGGWRMPTQEEWNELLNNTTNTWTTQNSVEGMLFTGSNGNSLFLPFAGHRENSGLQNGGRHGDYWSSSLRSDERPYTARHLHFHLPGYIYMTCDYRSHGLSVRAVYASSQISSYTINVMSNPTVGGVVSGGGDYPEGAVCTLTATANAGYAFSNWTENGNAVSTDANYTFTVSGDRTLVANFTANGGGGGNHAYVDLGLPSGTLWATCNIGAESPEDYGDYFAWGETQPKDTYNWSTYQYCNGSSNTLTKYCNDSSYGYNGFSDNLTTLLPEDDAATANWGNGWRMPTKEEFEELYNNTTVTWIVNGVDGRLFTASNGNSLFLPAAGYRSDSSLSNADSYGYYWSSSLDTDYHYYPYGARAFSFYMGNYYMGHSYRHCGRSVRAVRSSGQN